jgi:hypothetical protein
MRYTPTAAERHLRSRADLARRRTRTLIAITRQNVDRVRRAIKRARSLAAGAIDAPDAASGQVAVSSEVAQRPGKRAHRRRL